jgi:sec-independent protein translocase protein TatA
VSVASGFLSPVHVLLLLVVVLLLFGTKRLPELGRSLGSGLRSFKHSLDGTEEDEHKPLDSG